MNFLEERIIKDGVVKEGNVLKVDSFLNHQMDIHLLNEMGAEFKRRFADKQINKILTIEASGIGIACIAAQHFDVPVVFAKKSQSINLDGDMYVAEVESFTHKCKNHVIVAQKFLSPEDHVLLIDDLFEFYALVIYSIVLFLILRKFFRDVQRKYQMLLHATNELAEGNLDVVIEGDAGVFMPIQKELCRIQQGFKKAVDEEVKNERMKTELVTNVSHDLRTPLTAIITYTDLLKNETDPEKQKEYIEVLERKSFRLKVLIEDLFEISKAASKSVKMNYMQVDLVGLIRQVELENDSKIQDAKLEFRWKLPDHKVIMWLDSEKTYRIFENLIVNITKYAMAQTRVYIEMKEFSDKVSISMKNVSATELDFDVNEITDRFVRGDSSRNTEGSGLGLAIAKSFIELQHGTLQITTEADLFKAEIVLPRLSEGQTGQTEV